jgi:hypothetical protein
MWIDIPSRRTYTLRAMGMFILAIAVFGWGLQYKLSLYDAPDSNSNSALHAKLLSEKERPASSFDVASTRSASPQSSIFYLAFLLIAIISSLHLAVSLRARTLLKNKESRQQRYAALDFFSFRPPPALLRSHQAFPLQ